MKFYLFQKRCSWEFIFFYKNTHIHPQTCHIQTVERLKIQRISGKQAEEKINGTQRKKYKAVANQEPDQSEENEAQP